MINYLLRSNQLLAAHTARVVEHKCKVKRTSLGSISLGCADVQEDCAFTRVNQKRWRVRWRSERLHVNHRLGSDSWCRCRGPTSFRWWLVFLKDRHLFNIGSGNFRGCAGMVCCGRGRWNCSCYCRNAQHWWKLTNRGLWGWVPVKSRISKPLGRCLCWLQARLEWNETLFIFFRKKEQEFGLNGLLNTRYVYSFREAYQGIIIW